MTRRRWTALILAAGAAAVVALALFQPWRLFTRSTIDEAFPVVGAVSERSDPARTSPPTTATGASAPSGSASAAKTLASGTFVAAEHATSGTARILELADGSRHVRLEDFSTSDGPDIHVWLTDQPAGGDDWGRYDDGRYVALGLVKATDGNQNYVIPSDADLTGLVSVVIWCDRFNVAFGTAALAPPTGG